MFVLQRATVSVICGVGEEEVVVDGIGWSCVRCGDGWVADIAYMWGRSVSDRIGNESMSDVTCRF